MPLKKWLLKLPAPLLNKPSDICQERIPGTGSNIAPCVRHLLAGRIASVGILVVSNPAFIYFSGERYLKTVAPPQLDYLYPFAGLLKNRVLTAAGSDAPIAPVKPSGRDLWGGHQESKRRQDRFGERKDRDL